MSVQNQSKRIERNGESLQSSDTLSEALTKFQERGTLVRKLDEQTHTVYGWTFGNDDKGYYFYRNYNQA